MSEKKTIKVAAAVIRDGERVFATARGYGDYKGWWEFPGGKVEPGETSKEALVREIREELSAKIRVGELIRTIEYDYPAFHLSMDCFWAEVCNGELLLREAEAARWLSALELYSVKWLPADEELIEDIKKELFDQTLCYYEEHAQVFSDSTLTVYFSDIQELFLSCLPEKGLILDFGCGSGRDTKAFLAKGYPVEAVDGSEKLCRIAEKNTGIAVKQMLFGDLKETEKYEGIWACASILHLPKEELTRVLKKMGRALKTDGVIYTSFKYGEGEGYRNGRYFTDFTPESFSDYMKTIPELEVKRVWETGDARPDRAEEKWLNVLLCRKKA